MEKACFTSKKLEVRITDFLANCSGDLFKVGECEQWFVISISSLLNEYH